MKGGPPSDAAPLLASTSGRLLASASQRLSGGAPTTTPALGPAGDWRVAARTLVLGSRMNLLLVCMPFAMIAHAAHWGDGWTFLFALLAICPLAERLGFVTEQLAQYTNSTLGGLLNATFGNATEVIVSVAAMRNGLLRIVQLSLLGSILSNMLLVLGCAFFFGGLKHKEQRFNASATGINLTLLLLAVMAQSLPAMLTATGTELHAGTSALAFSRFTAFVLFNVYGAFLYFQLVTHRHLYEDAPDGDDDADDDPIDAAAAAAEDGAAASAAAAASMPSAGDDGLLTRRNSLAAQALAPPPASAAGSDGKKGDDDEEDELVLTFSGAIGCLAGVTVLIAILSEYLVDAIEGAAAAWGLPLSFISVILLPIVGNAAEHMSAVIFAMHNKMDLALGIAVGSSTQIALLVTPGCVLLAAAMGRPLDLNLQPFETGSLLVATLMLAFALADGRANWLKGVALVAGYVVIAAAYAAHDDPRLLAEHTNDGGARRRLLRLQTLLLRR
jgi:Ca2+:H+ antiporter